MKEELISFETAKLANSKGFKFDYNLVNTLYYRRSDKILIDKSYHSPDDYAAPTQSLLQKWLREVHNIHVTPYISDISVDIYGCSIKWHDNAYKEQFVKGNIYEKALEVGLKEALKLI